MKTNSGTTARQTTVDVHGIKLNNGRPLVLIAGPCVIENQNQVMQTALFLKRTCQKLKVSFVFKSSFDKANRSSISSYRGPGLRKGLEMLAGVKDKLGIPILVDVHETLQVAAASVVADVLQIPAFLCRQTDLIAACARTGLPVNVKKGQFMSPWEVKNILAKIEHAGNRRALFTERGTVFGYNNLVVDMRSLEVMKSLGYPVVFDATHSVQLPGGQGKASGGQREYVLPLSKAAVAVGVAALFVEVHANPDAALSDGPNAVKLADMEKFLKQILALDRLVKHIR